MSDRDGTPIEFDAEPHGDASPDAHGDPAGGPWLKIEEAIAALAMALICLISLANVVVRYLTDISFCFHCCNKKLHTEQQTLAVLELTD